MTPPGFNGPKSPNALPSQYGEVAPPVLPLAETIPADVEMYLTPRTVNLSGQTILVVFNPAARGGRIAKELPYLQRTLEGAGAKVIPIETVADEGARRERIASAARSALAEGSRIFVLPYGGDGTIWESVGEVLRAANVPLDQPIVEMPTVREFNSRVSFFFKRKAGTAEDNAVQVRAPSRIKSTPGFLRGAVELPFWFPTVEVNEQPGRIEAAGHNFGIGCSGFIFSRRMENLKASPDSVLNRGVMSYVRLLPAAMMSRYGMVGFDVELKHYGRQGELIREANMLASEVITTPNRIMASIGGVPGAWGENKVVVLPPFPKGFFAITEYIVRGLGTKLGLNLVGPNSRLRTLSDDRQWLIRPGERIEAKVRVPTVQPRNFLWRVLRLAHEENFSWRFFKPGPEVPLPGESLSVPAQRNGEVVPATSGFTIRSPGVHISMMAYPNSLAVRLARASALINGNVPLISDAQVTSFLEDHEPAQLQNSAETREARTGFISQPRLWRLLKHHSYAFDQAPELLLASQYVDMPSQLANAASPRAGIGNFQDFLLSTQGVAWRRAQDPVSARWLRGAPPLLAGLAALFGAERLADGLGLDPVRQRELRFGLVVYGSHLANTNMAPLWEVAANRILRRPYDFVRVRQARAAGETFLQYTFEQNSSVLRSLASSWRSSIGFESGLRSLLWREGATVLPRAMWNMGQGLMMSRIAEHLVQGMPQDSWLFRYGPSAAFFLPDVAKLAAPSRAVSLLEMRPMQWASRAFAVGFMGDMAFTGIYRLQQGERATYEQWINHRASEARMESDSGFLGWRHIPHWLAPSLADYWDSHNFFFGGANGYRRHVQEEDARQSAVLRESIQVDLTWLPQVLHRSPAEIFESGVQLSDVEQNMLEQLLACRGGPLLRTEAGFEETAAYLRRQYRGVVANPEEARQHLARIHAYQIQQSLAYLHSVDVPENEVIRSLFDEQGRLRPNREAALERWRDPQGAAFSLLAS